MHYFSSFVTLLLLLPSLLSARVLVMTHCYNKPEYICYQQRTFQKFLKDDYEFVVFNDASSPAIAEQVQALCSSLQVRSIRVPQKIHKKPYYLPRQHGVGGASAECAETIQYMLDTVGFDHPDVVVLIDSDMFLVRPFSIRDCLGVNDVVAHPQVKKGPQGPIIHFLPNLLFFNMPQLVDKRALCFNLGRIDGVFTDSGGFTHYYISRHPALKWHKIDCINTSIQEDGARLSPEVRAFLHHYPRLFQPSNWNRYGYEFYNDYSFLHFRAGSNWNQASPQAFQERKDFLLQALDEILQ